MWQRPIPDIRTSVGKISTACMYAMGMEAAMLAFTIMQSTWTDILGGEYPGGTRSMTTKRSTVLKTWSPLWLHRRPTVIASIGPATRI